MLGWIVIAWVEPAVGRRPQEARACVWARKGSLREHAAALAFAARENDEGRGVRVLVFPPSVAEPLVQARQEVLS